MRAPGLGFSFRPTYAPPPLQTLGQHSPDYSLAFPLPQSESNQVILLSEAPSPRISTTGPGPQVPQELLTCQNPRASSGLPQSQLQSLYIMGNLDWVPHTGNH